MVRVNEIMAKRAEETKVDRKRVEEVLTSHKPHTFAVDGATRAAEDSAESPPSRPASPQGAFLLANDQPILLAGAKSLTAHFSPFPCYPHGHGTE